MRTRWLPLLSLLTACDSDPPKEPSTTEESDTVDTNDVTDDVVHNVTPIVTDADGDGVAAAEDCDDNDPSRTARANDGDCDGVPTAEDCDDNDTSSPVFATDADCDGTSTAEDCDDRDPGSLTRADDGDCDSVLTAADCDDTDPSLLAIAGDPDCDGVQRIIAMLPADQQTEVDIDDPVVIVFADPLDVGTLGGLRIGVSGVLDGLDQTQWVDTMPGELTVESDGRTVTWRPDRGRLQEFETLHWIEVDGVTNTNGQGMTQVRSIFQTSVVDEDYIYRLENGQFDGSLDTLPGEPINAYLSEPFGRNYVGSNWIFTREGGRWQMTNLWLGPTMKLESADGSSPALMVTDDGYLYTGQLWSVVAAVDNPHATTSTSPYQYWLESLFQGSRSALGFHSSAPSGESYFGMKDKDGAVYADQIWTFHNYGPR